MTKLQVPTRWILALGLVGLLALIVAAFPHKWVGASTTPTTPSAGVLDHIVLSATQLTVSSGAQRQFTVSGFDVNNNAVTDITASWTKVNGPGTITTGGLFTAGTGPATTEIKVTVTQTSHNVTLTGTSTITINAPPPTPVPTKIPQNPAGPTPTPIPVSSGEASGVISPVNGGHLTVQTSTASGTSTAMGVSVPSGATTGYVGGAITKVSSGNVPPATSTALFKVAGQVYQVSFTDSNGNPVHSFKDSNGNPVGVTVTVGYTQAAADAAGGANNLKIEKYDSPPGAWVDLTPDTVDHVHHTLSVTVYNFSLFAVGVPVPPPATPTPVSSVTPTPTPVLPPTGGYAPSSGAVGGLIVLGLVLMSGGLFVVRRVRPHREAKG